MNCVNLADPDFEPTDAQLNELSARAFAGVRAAHDRALTRLRSDIATARKEALDLRATHGAQAHRRMRPVLLLVAGPNGAGKTTVTARLRQDRWSEGVEYLNPDDVARDRFGDWNSPDAVLKAAQWTAARREELLATNSGIALETVLSCEMG